MDWIMLMILWHDSDHRTAEVWEVETADAIECRGMAESHRKELLREEPDGGFYIRCMTADVYARYRCDTDPEEP